MSFDTNILESNLTHILHLAKWKKYKKFIEDEIEFYLESFDVSWTISHKMCESFNFWNLFINLFVARCFPNEEI